MNKEQLLQALQRAQGRAWRMKCLEGECDVDYLMDYIIEEVKRIDEDV